MKGLREAWVPQGSVLSPTFTVYTYINDTSQIPGVYLGLVAGDTCIYATVCKEVYVDAHQSSPFLLNDYK
jgi:hypothetical protein